MAKSKYLSIKLLFGFLFVFFLGELSYAQCSIYYRFRNDEVATPVGSNGNWVRFINNADRDCDEMPGCGIRVGVSCANGSPDQVRVSYEFEWISVVGPNAVQQTPWSGTDGSIQWGPWAYYYQNGHTNEECRAGVGRRCGISMTASLLGGGTCDVDYQIRAEERMSPLESNGTKSYINLGNRNENCDDSPGCGIRATLDCGITATPPPGNETRSYWCEDDAGFTVANSFCDPGALQATTRACGSTDCTVTSGTTWSASGNTCTVPADTTITAGSSLNVIDSTSPTTGSITYSCSATGVLSDSGATCSTPPASCTLTSASPLWTWNTGLNFCFPAADVSIPEGTTVTVVDTGAGATGSQDITCSNAATNSMSRSNATCSAAGGLCRNALGLGVGTTSADGVTVGAELAYNGFHDGVSPPGAPYATVPACSAKNCIGNSGDACYFNDSDSFGAPFSPPSQTQAVCQCP